MTIKLKVPSRWSELTQKDLEYFTRLLLKNTPESDLMTLCFLKFAGLKLIKKTIPDSEGLLFIFKKKGLPRFTMNSDQTSGCVNKLTYLIQDVTLFPLPGQIKQYIPYDYRLFDVNLEQYLLLDSAYQGYLQTNDITALNRMMAVMYHLPEEQWNVEQLKNREKRFKRIPLFRKYIICLWFSGLKKWIIDKYYYVFNTSESSMQSHPDEIVMQLLSALNEGNITLNKSILATGVHEALFELNRKIEQSRNV